MGRKCQAPINMSLIVISFTFLICILNQVILPSRGKKLFLGGKKHFLFLYKVQIYTRHIKKYVVCL